MSIKTSHMMECSMVQLLKDFCHENDVPHESADDILAEYHDVLSDAQIEFLHAYIALWEAMDI